MMFPKQLATSLSLVLLTLPLAGCPCLWDPQQCIPVNSVENMLDKALGELHQQPKMWETTLTNLVKQMEASGSNLTNEVQEIYNSMLGQTTGEFSCRADFVGDRVSQRLQALAHSINPQRWAMPQLTPVICSTQPAGPLAPGSDKFVKFYGYDLKLLAMNSSFKAILRYSDNGEIVLSSAGFISAPHDYMLTLDLQSPAVQQAMKNMDRSRGPQLVLTWGNEVVETDRSEESALAIEIPYVPTQPTAHEQVSTLGPYGGNWGDWQPPGLCPPGTWAIGGSLRIEPSLGGDRDDTALNGIRLSCASLADIGRATEISSGEGFWGEWQNMGSCSGTYVTAARVRIEPSQGKGDDTGAVDAEFICADGSTLKGVTHHNWGEWKPIQSCPGGTAVCGIEGRIERQQGDGDDTAMNDVKFVCCRLH